MPFSKGEAQKLAQIEGLSSQVAVNVQALVAYSRSSPWEPSSFAQGWDGVGQPGHPPTLHAPDEASHARRSILTNLGQLQVLLEQPADFLQRLARQNQLLACLRWLIDYQVLACIPLQGSVPMSEVAALTDAPEKRLAQVVQMMATSGFLCEPQPGQLAHTTLSAPFVSDLNLLDASLFLSETATPAAYEMTSATRRWGLSTQADQTAYNIALDTPSTFSSACDQSARLRRQWSAYLLCGMGDVEAGVKDVLSQLNWQGLSSSTVVDSTATSTEMATALAKLYPLLRFIVQMSNAVESNSNSSTTMPGRIVVQQRALGTPQHVRDAALFVIRFPATSVATTSRIRSELQAHVGVLGANLRARLLLVLPSVLCGHEGMVNAEVEAMARMRDLTSWQLANEGETEMSPLLDLVRGIHDGAGRIVVVSKFAARHHPAVALEMRYQSYAEVELQSPRSKQAGYLLDDL